MRDREKAREYHRQWRAANPDKVAAEREKNRERSRRARAENPEKMREASRRYRRKNPERAKEGARRRRAENPEKEQARILSWKHSGLRPEDWPTMRDAQGGQCFLCGDLLPDDQSEWNVDHDHRCCGPKRSCAFCRRGLACSRCNKLIGLASDDPERLRRIAGNLEAAIADVNRRLAGKPEQAGLFELGEEISKAVA